MSVRSDVGTLRGFPNPPAMVRHAQRWQSRRAPHATGLLLAVFILASATAFKPSTPPRLRSAILISWDGALREHINDCLKRNQLPNLAQLIKEGRMVDIEVSGHVTDTKSGHAQMLTGYDPNLTGVYSNTRFRPIPHGYSIFERLQQAFGKKDIATIMVTGKAMGLGPGAPRIPAEAEAPSPTSDEPSDEEEKQARRVEKIRLAGEQNVSGQPFYLVKSTLTAWDGDQPRDARSVGQKALAIIEKFGPQGRFFLFIHFGDADVNGHKYGEDSREYDDALLSLDTWLGRMVAELKADGLYNFTALYVTSDHGFDVATTHHGKATHAFLATNDPQVTSAGEQRDITPTILQALGVDVSTITPALPGKSLRKKD
ncbi:MAG TPA: alkaline phosphatase family protein [Polyangia bacterium]|nr:alkaline phosphatase family protein [Polyangia bacterium]